jgi:hypothetical protein
MNGLCEAKAVPTITLVSKDLLQDAEESSSARNHQDHGVYLTQHFLPFAGAHSLLLWWH